MASEIKVDTIVNAGGDNDTGIDLATNDQILLKVANATKLTMNSTGQTTIVGEGGTTTTSLQSGLSKAVWSGRSDGTPSATAYNSFNIASITDLGAGNPQCNYTNAMSSATYGGVTGGWNYSSATGVNTHIGAMTTAKFNLYHIENGSPVDADEDSKPITGAIFGDLA
jgi:hypothetical protein